jgi:hypothetical protein
LTRQDPTTLQQLFSQLSDAIKDVGNEANLAKILKNRFVVLFLTLKKLAAGRVFVIFDFDMRFPYLSEFT